MENFGHVSYRFCINSTSFHPRFLHNFFGKIYSIHQSYLCTTMTLSHCRSAYLVNGAITGGLFATKVGKIGLVGGFGGVSVGAVPMVGAGMVLGAATYGGITAIAQGDKVAIGSVGLGTIAGMGVATTIGNIGVAGSFGAIKFGMAGFGIAGGLVGLGLYGMAKILDSAPTETAFQAFDRMATVIDDQFVFQQAYIEALLELTLGENDRMVQFLKLDVEPELQRLKSEMKRQQDWMQNKNTLNNVSIGDCLHTLKHHTNAINTIALHPDGKTIATGSDDTTIVLWDLQSGKPIHYFYLTHAVQSIAISPDGKTIIAAADQRITIWNLETRQYIGIFFKSPAPNSHDRLVQCVAFSHNSALAFSGSHDRTIRIWRNEHRNFIQEKLKRTLIGHTETVFSIVVSRDGQWLVSGGADSTIRIWTLSGWADPQVLCGHHGWVNTIALNSAETLLASGGSDGTLKIWHFPTGQLLLSDSAHRKMIRSIIFNPQSNQLASIGNDGEIKLWEVTLEVTADLNMGEQRTVMLLHRRSFPGTGVISFSQDGTRLINGQNDGTITIWQIA